MASKCTAVNWTRVFDKPLFLTHLRNSVVRVQVTMAGAIGRVQIRCRMAVVAPRKRGTSSTWVACAVGVATWIPFPIGLGCTIKSCMPCSHHALLPFLPHLYTMANSLPCRSNSLQPVRIARLPRWQHHPTSMHRTLCLPSAVTKLGWQWSCTSAALPLSGMMHAAL